MDFRLVVFDMAGTTVHDPGLVAAALVGALHADDCDITFSDAQALMGYAKPDAIRRLLVNAGQQASEARVAQIHIDFVSRMLDTYRTHPDVTAMAGAEELFNELRNADVRIALNTAFSREIADAIVTRLGWHERCLIDGYISADQVAEGRPSPYMIRHFMERFGIDDAQDVAKVGDTEVDIREGRNAGCGLVVAVTTGAYSRESLAAHEPDRIIDHLNELMPLLHSSPQRAHV